jgi:hypothetical protein
VRIETDLTPYEVGQIKEDLFEAQNNAVALILKNNEDITKRQAKDLYYEFVVNFYGLNQSSTTFKASGE